MSELQLSFYARAVRVKMKIGRGGMRGLGPFVRMYSANGAE